MRSVIDGLTLEAVERATAAGLHAVRSHQNALALVTSGNYGGKLGPFHIRLHDLGGGDSGPQKRVFRILGRREL